MDHRRLNRRQKMTSTTVAVLLATVYFVSTVSAVPYSKYGRTCKDIGCGSDEVCVMAEDPCTYYQRDKCGRYPTCTKTDKGGESCRTKLCTSGQYCKTENGRPTCVNTVPGSEDNGGEVKDISRRQGTSQSGYPTGNGYEPSAPSEDTKPPIGSGTSSNSGRPSSYPSGSGYPSGSSSGYPSGSSSGYPSGSSSGYPASSGYPSNGNSGYPSGSSSGYPASSGYPSNGNSGYPSGGRSGYPSSGNSGYPSGSGYPSSSGYPSGAGYPSQGSPQDYGSRRTNSNSNSGYPSGQYDPYNQRGYNQGGYNQGGYNQGGYNQGGYNQGGYNQGGYRNQGGYDPYPGQMPPKKPSIGDQITDFAKNFAKRVLTQAIIDKIGQKLS